MEKSMKTPSVQKNAILNLIKQMLYVAFPLLTFPYVSQILLEVNYGKYSFGMSIVSYVSLAATLGINAYAIREGARIRSNPEMLTHFAQEIFTISLITTLVAYVGLFVALVFWDKLFEYRTLILVQCSIVVFITLGADWVNQIFEDYQYMTVRYIVVKVISLICIYMFIKKKDDYILYACIISGSDILANLMNIFYVRRYVKLRPVLCCHFKKHIGPILVLAMNSLALTIYVNMAITMLGVYYSDSVVGVYSFASKIYGIAKSVLSAVVVVTIPRLSVYLGEGNRDAYYRLLNKVFKFSVAFMLPLIAGIFVLSREVILILGGENYIAGNLVLRILSIALLPVSIGNICSNGILIANRREKFCILATMVGIVISMFLNLLLIGSFGIEGAAFSTLISEIISCALAICFSKQYIGNALNIDRDYLSIGVGVLCIVVCCVVLRGCFDSTLMTVVSCVLVGGGVYGIILMVMRNSICQIVFNNSITKIITKRLKHSCK